MCVVQERREKETWVRDERREGADGKRKREIKRNKIKIKGKWK